MVLIIKLLKLNHLFFVYFLNIQVEWVLSSIYIMYQLVFTYSSDRGHEYQGDPMIIS